MCTHRRTKPAWSPGLIGVLIALAVTRTAATQQVVTISPAGQATVEQMVAYEKAKLDAGWVPPQRVIPEGKAPWKGLKLPEKTQPTPVPARTDYGGSPLREPTLARNFLALLDDNRVIPPDTMGAIGPTHLVTMLNSQVRFQNRGGTSVRMITLESFWAAGGLNGSPFDPKIFYDVTSQRWIAVVVANGFQANSAVWFAISDGSDPLQMWKFYTFPGDTTGQTWPDYPGVGFNKNWIAITNNMYSTNPYDPYPKGIKMWAIDKSTALAGGNLTVKIFNVGFDIAGSVGGQPVQGFTLKPAITMDPNEETLYCVDHRANIVDPVTFVQLVRISRLTGPANNPAWSVVPGGNYPGTGLFKVINDYRFDQIDAAQQGVSVGVETNDPRMCDVLFRHGRLWCTHSGGLPLSGSVNRTAVFWYELNPANISNPIVQCGLLDGGAGVHYFFSAISVNKYADVCLGFSRSDSSMYVSAAFTGRYGRDPANTMRSVKPLKAGQGQYTKDYGSGRVRWGDYSAAGVDPNDDMTFWTIQEFASTGNRWSTWWGEVQITTDCNGNGVPDDQDIAAGTSRDCNLDGYPDECQTLPPPTIVEHPQSTVLCEGGSGTLQVTASGAEPFSYQWRKDGNEIPGATEAQYQITAATPATAGSYDVLVRDNCMDPNTPALISNPAEVTVRPGPSITGQPVSRTIQAGDPVTFEVTASGAPPLTYQWRKDGQPIAGATATSYTIPLVMPTDAGDYDVVITSNCGPLPSSKATLSVTILGPTQPFPADRATAQNTALTLRWQTVLGASAYEVRLGTQPNPPVVATVTTTAYNTGTLEYGTLYYWQVVATHEDIEGAGPLWAFMTKKAPPPPPPPLQPPDVPAGPFPAPGATDVATGATLTWNEAARADTYKLLLGTDPQLAGGFEGTTLRPYWSELTLAPDTTYYWRVIAHNAAGFTPGPVWSFTTAPAAKPEPAETTTPPAPTPTPQEPNTTPDSSQARPDGSGFCPTTGLALVLASLAGLWTGRRRRA